MTLQHRADPCQHYQATLLAGGMASYLASLYLQSPINFGLPLQPCHQLCELWQAVSESLVLEGSF